jgi:hypothetical protein
MKTTKEIFEEATALAKKAMADMPLSPEHHFNMFSLALGLFQQEREHQHQANLQNSYFPDPMTAPSPQQIEAAPKCV